VFFFDAVQSVTALATAIDETDQGSAG
jgi:hypothetical protein